MKVEEALSSAGAIELDYISRTLGLGGVDPNTSEGGLELARGAIRYVCRRDGIQNLRTMVEAACDMLGR